MIRAIDYFYDKIPSSVDRNANLRIHSLASRRRKLDLSCFIRSCMENVVSIKMISLILAPLSLEEDVPKYLSRELD